MPYFVETIHRGVPYDINVDATIGNTTAITILKIDKKDRIAAAEHHTVPGAALTTLTDTAGPKIDRLIVAVHPAGDSTVTVEIRQPPGTSFTQTCDGDTDIVFDTAP
jgi:hypothetical protein